MDGRKFSVTCAEANGQVRLAPLRRGRAKVRGSCSLRLSCGFCSIYSRFDKVAVSIPGRFHVRNAIRAWWRDGNSRKPCRWRSVYGGVYMELNKTARSWRQKRQRSCGGRNDGELIAAEKTA
eukprot:6178849-Pleurochrysis_carterae.AAC.1